MSHYSQVLQSVIDAHFEGEQSKLARASKVAQSILSRHCRDEKQPDCKTLEKICKAVPPENRSALVAAYLRDLCPSSLESLVSVTEVDTKGAHVLKEAPNLSERLDRLDPATRRAVERLVDQALRRAAARRFLQATDEFVAGQSPSFRE